MSRAFYGHVCDSGRTDLSLWVEGKVRDPYETEKGEPKNKYDREFRLTGKRRGIQNNGQL